MSQHELQSNSSDMKTSKMGVVDRLIQVNKVYLKVISNVRTQNAPQRPEQELAPWHELFKNSVFQPIFETPGV